MLNREDHETITNILLGLIQAVLLNGGNYLHSIIQSHQHFDLRPVSVMPAKVQCKCIIVCDCFSGWIEPPTTISIVHTECLETEIPLMQCFHPSVI